MGQDIVDMDVSTKDRIKDDELLGKRYSMWTDKVENTTEVVVSHPY
ncbi:terminase [Peptostreptococcus anaerobius]|nr:terminase [Peptostreptococcus anaerobius]MDB8850497.1 terminase [Peptostreptococcus anaerobius]MDB8854197.1 terminase [Peptostreptococcus anaerobius]MDB8856060.1 terminase [Peptostreptococcus anaerobius]MDU1175276.1 terminase [Peptostreptococcus anaerobius]MDU1233748.1 terminase [Peptostreptococcus anaerobius]